MSKVETVVKTINEKLSLSRRGFMKGMLAVGATASLYGCSKGDDTEEVFISDTSLPASDTFANAKSTFRYGTSAHNCGGRCVIRAQVVDGRIVRFLTDDSKVDYEGNTFELDGRNSAQAKACARCRGYKGRLYHPGRLRYPLKQTKKRGDMSGFVRITWKEALDEISDRLLAVTNEYGPETFHTVYACGNIYSPFQGASYPAGVFSSNSNGNVNGLSWALRLLGGGAPYANDYSFHQNAFFGTGHTGYAGSNANANNVADFVNNIVLWGSNIVSTINPLANPWVKATQDMKKRNPNAKIWYIGPEMSDSGISMADEWIQIKPSTDNALIMAIIYELIATNKLDVDYLDTMVYGFCDSPEYWVAMGITDGYYEGTATSRGRMIKVENPNGKAGTVFMTAPTVINLPNWAWTTETGAWWINSSDGAVTTEDKTDVKNWSKITTRWQNTTNTSRYAYSNPMLSSIVNGNLVNKVDAVPAGRSLMSYVLGDGNLPTGAEATKWANYSASSTNYVAKQFATGARFTACSYIKPTNTKYQTKLDYQMPKTPEWASAITGVSAGDIRRLASFFATAGDEGQQILNCWSGGQLKQAEGCYTLFAIQTLNILVKNWGVTGANVIRNPMARNQGTDPKQIVNSDVQPATWNNTDIPTTAETPVLSCTQWYNAVKFAFGADADGGNIQGFTPAVGTAYFDDGGAKSLVKWNRTDKAVNTFTDSGSTFFAWDKNGTAASATDLGSDTNVKFSGYRFIFNTGGNIPLNQHANAIDSMKMYEKLPAAYGTSPAALKDAFYLVTFDNFMAPSARYSDYVLPAKTTWEQADFKALHYNNNIFIDEVISGPGESKSTWDFARDFIASYNEKKAGVGTGATQAAKFAPDMLDFKTTFKKAYIDKISTSKNKAFYGKSWEQFLEKPFTTNKPNNTATTASKSTAKTAIETYLATDKALPFTTSISTITANSAGYGDIGANYFAETASCPNPSGRFHVYSGALVWRYENRYSKWHGYLPADKRGQRNVDLDDTTGIKTNATSDGYKRVLPIPMYFAYQDYFMEAYGLYGTVTKSTDVQTTYPFQLTTTHDKFRAHSSQSENPYLRELTHMTVGGEAYSGNDANTYAISYNPESNMNVFPAINSLISSTGEGSENASYSEILLNPEDASSMGIVTGDLLQVENPIGAVRVVAKLSNRCVKGFVGLHQGCWFDPRTIGGKTVDVGGNCNTLMASQPSRADHGNAQQSALVKITKVATA